MLMLVFAGLSWWYVAGWQWALKKFLIMRVKRTIAFFSMPDLLKTLFQPFRQDSVSIENVPSGQKIQAFGANLVARLIGFMIRVTLLVSGLVATTIAMLFGIITVIIWPFVPLLPALAVGLYWQGVGKA